MVSHDIQLLAPKPTKMQDTRVKWTSQDWSCLVYVGSEVMFFIYGIGMFLIEKRNCKPVLTLFKATHPKNGICKCRSRGCSKLLDTRGAKNLGWLIVFEKPRVLGPDNALDWSLYLQTRKCFT